MQKSFSSGKVSGKWKDTLKQRRTSMVQQEHKRVRTSSGLQSLLSRTACLTVRSCVLLTSLDSFLSHLQYVNHYIVTLYYAALMFFSITLNKTGARLRSPPVWSLCQDSEGSQVAQVASLADIRAGAEDGGRAPIRIAVCGPVHGQLKEMHSVSFHSHLHPAPERKRLWETSRSTSQTFIGKSRSAEAIWKPFWQPVEQHTRTSAAFARTSTYSFSPLWDANADFPAPLIQVQSKLGWGWACCSLAFCFQAIVGISIDIACSTLTMSYLQTRK